MEWCRGPGIQEESIKADTKGNDFNDKCCEEINRIRRYSETGAFFLLTYVLNASFRK